MPNATGGATHLDSTGPVGIIGLGNMGLPMVRRFVGAGREVVALARSPHRSAAAREAGATVVDSIDELASLVAAVVLSVPADADVAEVCFGSGGLASSLLSGSFVIDTSTIAPASARQFATDFAELGIDYVDAPVSGGPIGVEQATLAVMAGGTVEAVEVAATVLSAFAGRFVHCGPSGAGQVAKACNQLIVVSTLQVVSEALVLAHAAGADVRAVREALLGGFAQSRVLELQGLRMIERDFAPRGTVAMQRKDVRVIQELAAQVGVKLLPAFDTAAAAVTRLDDAGGGALDHSALITVYEHDSDVSLGATPTAIMLHDYPTTEHNEQKVSQ